MRTEKLGNLGVIFDGPHATPVRRETGAYFLNISSLNEGRLDLSQSDHVDQEDFQKWTRRVQPQENDLLFSYETRLGQAALMPSDIEACLGRRMALLRPHPGKIDPRFLLYAWLSPVFKSQIDRRAVRGATVDRIPLNELADWDIPVLGALGAQRAISHMLGALDGKIVANEKVASIADEMFHLEWRKFYTEGEGWLKVSLGDVAPSQYGLTASAGKNVEGAYFLRVTDINKSNWIDWGSVPAVSSEGADFSKYELFKGDLLVARMGDPGKSAIYEENSGSAVFASYLVRLKPPSYEYGLFLYGFLKSDFFLEYADSVITGTVQRNMNAKLIRAAPLSVPSGEEIGVFARRVGVLRDKISACLKENSRLAATRDELLPLLMSGKITVKDAEKTVEEVV